MFEESFFDVFDGEVQLELVEGFEVDLDHYNTPMGRPVTVNTKGDLL